MNVRHASHVRPAQGESLSGDAVLVRAMDEATLLAVVDGLGHGEQANVAALRAIAALEEAAAGTTLDSMVGLCDRALRGTRGAALTLARVRGTTLEVVAVGNVALRTRDVANLSFLNMPGIVGSLRRTPRVATGLLGPRARVVLASDGVSSRFDVRELDGLDPERAARDLADRHGVTYDDVSVLVCDVI